MDNYILAANWNKSNIQDRLWYCMEEIDKDTMLLEEKFLLAIKYMLLKQKRLIFAVMTILGMSSVLDIELINGGSANGNF